MYSIDIFAKLSELEHFIKYKAYMDEYDGDDEHGCSIIRHVFVGLDEDEIKSLLVKICEIIELMKEENND